MTNFNMEYMDYSSIAIRMIRAARQSHDMRMCSRIDSILSPADIVLCIVELNGMVQIDLVLFNREVVTITVSKIRRAECKDASQDMIFEIRNEILA